MTIRSLIFWPHLIAGVCAGLVILLMSVTGVALTYERQLIAWSDSDHRSTPPQEGASPLPVQTLLARVRAAHPGQAPTAVTRSSDPTAPVQVSVGRQTLLVDAYSGAVLGQSSTAVRQLMSDLRAWHRWIAVEGESRATARAITGWSNFIFLFIVVTGAYLWIPRKWTWTHLRPVVLFGTSLRGKARDFNWHNVIGLWTVVPLFFVVLTALPISFPWANSAVYQLAGEAPPAPRGGGPGAGPAGGPRGREGDAAVEPVLALDGLDERWARAERQEPEWTTIALRLPTDPDAPLAFAIDRGDGGQPQLRSTLTLARATGEVVAYETFGSQSLGRRLRSLSRFAHTGEVLGLVGQTVAGLATAGAVVLVYTGIALSLRRLVAWVRRRGRTVTRAADVRQSPAA
ncbi:MAG: PepSY-associated TM helix domain-containing protein [Vicinamibacterales bacterium]